MLNRIRYASIRPAVGAEFLGVVAVVIAVLLAGTETVSLGKALVLATFGALVIAVASYKDKKSKERMRVVQREEEIAEQLFREVYNQFASEGHGKGAALAAAAFACKLREFYLHDTLEENMPIVWGKLRDLITDEMSDHPIDDNFHRITEMFDIVGSEFYTRPG